MVLYPHIKKEKNIGMRYRKPFNKDEVEVFYDPQGNPYFQAQP